jgi:RNA polymerase sigma-70 factor, ECF subfamily
VPPARLPSEILLSCAGGAKAALARVRGLDQALERWRREGQAAWPGARVAPKQFFSHLGASLAAEADPVRALERLRAADVFGACACAAGDPSAIAQLERDLLSKLPHELATKWRRRSFADEVVQALRERLLVAEPGRSPRIASYRGKGSLASWIRAAAFRMAVDLRRSEKDHVGLDDELDGVPSSQGDAELGYIKQRYARELKDAFEKTLGALSDQERNVIRMYYLENMTAAGIARLYRVHERTVMRWIERVRAEMIEQTRRRLAERLGVTSNELESLMALVRSQVQLSIRRYFR